MFAGFKPIKPLLHVEADKLSDEERYWNRLKEVSVFQESGNITCTDFLPIDPYFIASTCSSRFSIIDSKTCEPITTFNRIKSSLQCVAFRSDGNLAGVGTQNGQIHFFDAVRLRTKRGIKHPIRSFNAHNHRINSLAYSPKSTSFVSLADDGIIKLWDLSCESEPLWVNKAHSDHIRTGVFSSCNDHFLVTGSYDHTIKVWDVRSKGDEDVSILTMDHGKPVEKILLFPNETIVASAGGNTIKLWDLAAGGKIIHTIENHYKTITSMCFATNKSYLLSGGLDRRINLFRCDSGDFSLVKSWKVAAQVLSISMSPDDNTMVYGMTNLLSIYQRKTDKELHDGKNVNGDFFGEKKKKRKRSNSTNNTPLYIDVNSTNQIRRRAAPPVIQREQTSFGSITEPIRVELTAKSLDKLNIGVIDNLLRQRNYREFFSSSILKCKTNAELIVASLQQLRIRQKLYVAMSGHSDKVLLKFLTFMKTNLFKGSFFYILYDVLQVFFTIYAEEQLSDNIKKSIEELKLAISVEINVQKRLLKFLGVVSMLSSKSLSQKILNAEDKTNFNELEEQTDEMDVDLKPVNGDTKFHTIDDIIIVTEKNANATAKKVEWNF